MTTNTYLYSIHSAILGIIRSRRCLTTTMNRGRGRGRRVRGEVTISTFSDFYYFFFSTGCRLAASMKTSENKKRVVETEADQTAMTASIFKKRGGLKYTRHLYSPPKIKKISKISEPFQLSIT